MKKLLLGFALTTAVIGSQALAADLEPQFDSIYDWSGVYLGIFGAAIAVDGHYDATPLCVPGPCTVIDPDMSGIGYGFGVKAGADYQMDSFVFGIVGDWTFADEIADNEDPAEDTFLNMNHMATVRARAGWADGNTLLYVTGGFAAAEMEFGGQVGAPPGEEVTDKEWVYGWTAGGGIEHAFSDYLSASLEYLYVDLEDTDYTLINSLGEGGDVEMMYNDMHMVRAGLTFRFSL